MSSDTSQACHGDTVWTPKFTKKSTNKNGWYLVDIKRKEVLDLRVTHFFGPH